MRSSDQAFAPAAFATSTSLSSTVQASPQSVTFTRSLMGGASADAKQRSCNEGLGIGDFA
eukprot:1136048-Pleurochrysis_carterae.AAC.3